MNDEDLLEHAFTKFDWANATDPNQIIVNGEECPKELVFAKRLTESVLALNPDASVALRLASRCQHLCRWQIPRNSEPMGREGYLKWRVGLKKFHAAKSAEILSEVGCPDDMMMRVQDLNLKKNLTSDPDCQTLEDALCLVFLKYQFDDLIASTETEKMVRIVKKTWLKMSEQGQAEAQKITYSADAQAILARLSPDQA